MTPKEKAKELVLDKFQSIHFAIIAVNEIIEAIDWHEFENPYYEYWGEVKTEIEKYRNHQNLNLTRGL